jgi:hypothetical protein
MIQPIRPIISMIGTSYGLSELSLFSHLSATLNVIMNNKPFISA